MAEVFLEGIEEDILDGEQVAVVAVEFSSSLGLSDMDPVRRTIASTPEAVLLDKGFAEDGLIAIAVLPIRS